MHFIVTCMDKDNANDVRRLTRSAHLTYANDCSDTIKVGGPILSDEGEMIGSMLICEAESRGALEAVLAEDPYAKAGLFESTTIQSWKWVIGQPE